MTIKQQGGVFGRNPTFNNVTVDGILTVDQIVEKTGAAGITLDGVTLRDGNVVLDDGKGIDFSATAGTGTSELFDDYEEGTWTPAFQTSNNNMTVTHDVQTGFYTKVGNVVTCTGRLRTDAVSGGTGTVQIQGLPFTAKSGVTLGSVGVLSIGVADTWVAAPTGGYVNVGGTSLDLIKTGLTVILPADMTNAANSNGLWFSITYMAA